MTSQPPSPPPQPSEQVPTCYRHPDRETWVRCQRCERPICPDCMKDASVGFQCPECVAEGNKNVRQARSAYGGAVVTQPYVTWTILGLIALVFAGQWVTDDQVAIRLAMQPYAVASGDWYRLITSAFVHDRGNFFHVLFNGWAIYVIAPYLERALGHAKFAALYLLSALGGGVLGYWLDAPAQTSLGASGAVFGLFAAVFIIGRKQRLDIRGIATVIVLNLALTWVIPLVTGYGISWTAHVGGLITGAVLGTALVYAPAANRGVVQWAAIGATFAVLAVLVVVRTGMIFPA